MSSNIDLPRPSSSGGIEDHDDSVQIGPLVPDDRRMPQTVIPGAGPANSTQLALQNSILTSPLDASTLDNLPFTFALVLLAITNTALSELVARSTSRISKKDKESCALVLANQKILMEWTSMAAFHIVSVPLKPALPPLLRWFKLPPFSLPTFYRLKLKSPWQT